MLSCFFFLFSFKFLIIFKEMNVRVLIALLPLVAVCAARPSIRVENLNLTNSVELDPEGSFRLDWDFIYDEPTNPEFVFELRVATRGWMSIRFTNPELTKGDYFYGALDPAKPKESFFLDKHCDLVDGFGCETPDGPKQDVHNDFTIITLEYGIDYTVLRMSRLVDTGDLLPQDVVITVRFPSTSLI